MYLDNIFLKKGIIVDDALINHFNKWDKKNKVNKISNKMKKLILIITLSSLALFANAQLFKPVPMFPTKVERGRIIARGETPVLQDWIWRIDASVSFIELNYDKDLKKFIATELSAIGPAIGYQHFVAQADGTPFNNYGFSFAVMLGPNVYEPDFASLKLALQGNIMEYFKFGVTVTPKTSDNISHFGLFFGGGITF